MSRQLRAELNTRRLRVANHILNVHLVQLLLATLPYAASFLNSYVRYVTSEMQAIALYITPIVLDVLTTWVLILAYARPARFALPLGVGWSALAGVGYAAVGIAMVMTWM